MAHIVVAALYKFVKFSNCEAIRAALVKVCRRAGTKGTLLIAPEGINGTIAGERAAVDAVLDHVRSLPGCSDLEVKESRAAEPPFFRMKVRIKKEIVTMGVPDLDPGLGVGTYLNPREWNQLIADPDVVLIDTRNDYEVRVGSFAGAVNPSTKNFREFPQWFRQFFNELRAKGAKNPKIAMFCTGGIRCEKATAFAKAEGVSEVFHLKGGILKYLEEVPETQSLWDGECFVFDQRVAVKHGLELGRHSLCFGCRMPVGPADRASPLHVEGVSCVHCHDSRSEEQRRGYAERHRQVTAGAALGAPSQPVDESSRG